jgi:hypothetical protein
MVTRITVVDLGCQVESMSFQCAHCQQQYSQNSYCHHCNAGFWVLRRTEHCRREYTERTKKGIPIRTWVEPYEKNHTKKFLIPARFINTYLNKNENELKALDDNGTVDSMFDMGIAKRTELYKAQHVNCFACHQAFLPDATFRNAGQVVDYHTLKISYNINAVNQQQPMKRPQINNNLFCSLPCQTVWRDRDLATHCSACQNTFVPEGKKSYPKDFCSKECFKNKDKFQACHTCKKPFFVSIKARLAQKKGKKTGQHLFKGFCSRPCMVKKSEVAPWQREVLEGKIKTLALMCKQKHKVRFPESHRGQYLYCSGCKERLRCPA